jgi:hypothetical protein
MYRTVNLVGILYFSKWDGTENPKCFQVMSISDLQTSVSSEYRRSSKKLSVFHGEEKILSIAHQPSDSESMEKLSKHSIEILHPALFCLVD